MRIRIDRPLAVRLNLQPGDEVTIQTMTPELQSMLDSKGFDGNKFAHVVSDDGGDETAVIPASGETRGTRRDRSQTFSK